MRYLMMDNSFALFAAALLLQTSSCAVAIQESGAEADDSAEQDIGTTGYMDLNEAASSIVLYELQIRSANACDPLVGSPSQRAACSAKPSPLIPYRAEGMSCPIIDDLKRIRLGTLDDLLEDTSDFRKGITLRYVRENVGANTLWLMPLFPNNDTWAIPDACDDLGSPYAVRDYMHVSGTLSRSCISQGRDEHSTPPCWANAELETLIADAHAHGQRIMLDVALNHFGHNYQMYDVPGFRSVRQRAMSGEDLGTLWDFSATYDDAYLHPRLVDDASSLKSLASADPDVKSTLAALKARCPSLSDAALVPAYHAFHEAFDWERGSFACDEPFLERAAPGFYLGSDRFNPAESVGGMFTNNWRDVKFLFHKEENLGHQWQFARTREYLFRILNWWVSRGIDGFRLDHTTDPDSGLGANEWKYVLSKVDYYAWRRGQKRPIFLAEEFHDQVEMNKVVDIMTDGYVGDMTGRNGQLKDTAHVERVLENTERHLGHAFSMTALETHDEKRLTEGTGFDVWTGAGFWGIGATARSTPMIVMGQELGEWRGLGFRRSDYLHSRFEGSDSYYGSAADLAGFYHQMIQQRLRAENRALLSPNHAYLRSRWNGQADPRLLALVKWSEDRNVMFVFHNLWNQSVEQSYYLDPALASDLWIQGNREYRFFDVLSGTYKGGCRTGAELAHDLYVAMDANTRAQWLRLESCPCEL